MRKYTDPAVCDKQKAEDQAILFMYYTIKHKYH
jgi:hypothetical protein